MDEKYTHIAMIIDRSGSMNSCWSDVAEGYKSIVKQNKKQEGKCTFTVATFDDQYDLLEDFTDIKAVKSELDVQPRGTTALLDAIGQTIKSVKKRIKGMEEADKPAKVMFVIQTDGHENSSKEYSKAKIKKMIDKRTEKDGWEFQFIGGDLESVREAASWGIKAVNTSTYNTENAGNTFDWIGTKMCMVRSASMDDYAATVAFNSTDKEILNESKNESLKKESTETK